MLWECCGDRNHEINLLRTDFFAEKLNLYVVNWNTNISEKIVEECWFYSGKFGNAFNWRLMNPLMYTYNQHNILI